MKELGDVYFLWAFIMIAFAFVAAAREAKGAGERTFYTLCVGGFIFLAALKAMVMMGFKP